ncbi:ABC transporter ATP-binding protein [Myroides sp. DW712]|uniref:ATP-binding cassette domain-containing protein n=1 Tax=Myroides sp. DW712 TaxID=3389800 RepID=UPI00397E25E1
MPSLVIDSLVYQLNHKPLLNNLYFQLETGEIVELIGANGKGKSTFLQVLFGTKKAQYLYMRIDQKVIRKPRHFQRYFALKPQFYMFPKQLRLGNILPKAYWNWPEFEGKRQEKIHAFATGIQQLIQTLFVLNLPQPFILLDEPFAGLSPLLQERLCTVLTEKRKTKGILIVNHLPDCLSTIRTRQVQLENGTLYTNK